MSAKKSSELPFLTGQFLLAMPGVADQRFAKSVIYLCAHSPQGAMGLVVNRLFGSLTFVELLHQLGIESAEPINLPIFAGGPVESGRGFVLHSTDFMRDGTMPVDSQIALTGTLDILRAIADGQGPERKLFALGYAGWGPGQLDAEIHANGWLTASADPDILFDADPKRKWERVLQRLGVNPALLSGAAGRA